MLMMTRMIKIDKRRSKSLKQRQFELKTKSLAQTDQNYVMEETGFDRGPHAVAEHVIHDYSSSGSCAVDVDVLA